MIDVVLVAILMVLLMCYGVMIVVIYSGDDYNDGSHDYFDINERVALLERYSFFGGGCNYVWILREIIYFIRTQFRFNLYIIFKFNYN